MPLLPLIIGIIAGLLLAALIAVAAMAAAVRKRKSAPRIQGYLDLIPDLTDQQRARVQSIRTVFLPKVTAIRQRIQDQRSELARLLFAEPADRDRIFRQADGVAEAQLELEHEVIEHILEEKDLLTPEQKKMFYEIIVSQFSGGGLGVHDVKNR